MHRKAQRAIKKNTHYYIAINTLWLIILIILMTRCTNNTAKDEITTIWVDAYPDTYFIHTGQNYNVDVRAVNNSGKTLYLWFEVDIRNNTFKSSNWITVLHSSGSDTAMGTL